MSTDEKYDSMFDGIQTILALLPSNVLNLSGVSIINVVFSDFLGCAADFDL